ncbi:MAG: iron-sulfur cluster assembly accessory protein [Candidatus Thermoplasmatota archaeon]|nr:iron-sulfur cluster assembly accessory protein [Candidatus Thermoplasmatota archaeon]
MITVTPKAAETIKSIVKDAKKDDPIRVFFAGYSCSGPAYMMAFDKKKDDDVEIPVDGFKLIYEKDLEGDLKEAVVDSVDTPDGPGVVVRVKSSGPSACSSCAGCH